ncbi:hypothetical protein M747DRAFT_319385 [Aspergillus niger ATCC 13496]|uniref:Uncharacterized protein n=3 Tax=Aspergillus niger TaxID=5061 RepID=A2QZS3_ASPNC|nr:hypothetical protein An12g05980 [Aspergillus niger]RDH14606.1 hypothetical protein M747DRAFT_319385 [Aspergillus niger ATCC 13496]CAK46305.1 hypothetical protein An12g05980 [Aspergillus niger]
MGKYGGLPALSMGTGWGNVLNRPGTVHGPAASAQIDHRELELTFQTFQHSIDQLAMFKQLPQNRAIPRVRDVLFSKYPTWSSHEHASCTPPGSFKIVYQTIGRRQQLNAAGGQDYQILIKLIGVPSTNARR